MEEIKHCTEKARLSLPWAGEIVHFCPVHANQLVMLANAMGAPIKPLLLPKASTVLCEQQNELTDEEKILAKTFPY